MKNSEIAEVFDELAHLLELRGENAFRVRAYRTAARNIADLSESVADILADPSRDLTQYAGIGATIAEKCKTLVETGQLPQLEELRASTPAVLLKMTRIPGLGIKKALALQQELNIESLEELRQACLDHRVQKLKGFAAKTEESILAGIDIAEAASLRMRIDQAERLVARLREHLMECDAIDNIEFAGSYRRCKETVGDIDILVVSRDANRVMDQLASLPGMVSQTARGETKMSIRVDEQFQVDLRVVGTESFGAALQYFTGSKEHNVAIRGRARKLGLTVNEYGVAKLDRPDEIFAGESEDALYGALGLRWIAPELREGRHEIEWSEAGHSPPPLIELKHIIADLHMHTTATDGSNSIEEMSAAARTLGLQYIAITDHSKRVSMAGGLDTTRLLEQWQTIDAYNARQTDGFRVLKGIECDILEAGPMDLPDEVLAQADWVLGSIHYGQKQSRQQITDRIVGALTNPHVDVIAHPTGRLIGSRPPYEVDMDAVIEAAAEFRKALELNANPMRLDLNEEHLMAAVRAGVPIAINTDAHSIDGLQVMRFGVMQARRALIEKDQVLNTWPLETFLQFLERS
ncbi:MAG: DNA polymerase/3'-5' exonuclease PolX [Planctomycetales bacterium]|nr:DNA polymerase/3'-5' exonuclease PolX [Planctomycetales bacterium]